jgi:hypothetical protein
MAKFIILFFLTAGSGVSYLTYTGIGQERLETLEKENIRSNSYRSGGSVSGGSWGSSSSSYNSSSYGYGK